MKLLYGALGATLTCAVALASANAAELPAPAPVGYKDGPYIFNWTGVYVGVQAGGIWDTENLKFGPPTESINFDGGVLGAQLGAQYQFYNNVVAGVEVSGFASDSTGSVLCPNPAFRCHTSLRNEIQVVGRLGYAWGNFLPYVKGGYASISNTFANTPATVFAVNSVNHGQDGWVVGGGLEYGLTNNIIIGIDYSHIEINTQTYISGGATFGVDGTADIVTGRLSYKFGAEYTPLK
jgi:outer membrane immunogenic protein